MRFLAYFPLQQIAKILNIWACSDYVLPQWYTPLRSWKKNFTLDCSRFFALKINNFAIWGFWVFFFYSIQQTNFMQENALIIIFWFCCKFCFHQHQNCKSRPTNFWDIIVWKWLVFYGFSYIMQTLQILNLISMKPTIKVGNGACFD